MACLSVNASLSTTKTLMEVIASPRLDLSPFPFSSNSTSSSSALDNFCSSSFLSITSVFPLILSCYPLTPVIVPSPFAPDEVINLVFSTTCSPSDLMRTTEHPRRPWQWMCCSDRDNDKEQQTDSAHSKGGWKVHLGRRTKLPSRLRYLKILWYHGDT